MQQQRLKAYLMWLLPLSFFAYQFILRLWPSVMMDQIKQQFMVEASGFGFMASLYYWGYAGLQIPIALFIDKAGARKTLFVCSLVCGLATLAFTYTDIWEVALASRFLIGSCSAVGFLGVSKVVSEWFTRAEYSRMIGFSFTFGLLGAIYGAEPLAILVNKYDWQNVALTLALISMLISFLILIFLRSPAHAKDLPAEEKFQIKDFGYIFANPSIWVLAIANLLMVGSLEGFADVWGINFLKAAFGLEKKVAAGLTMFIFIGMLFGGPLLSWFAKFFGNSLVVIFSGIGMALLLIILLNISTYNAQLLKIAFFALGVLCCYQVLVFAMGSEMVTHKYLGVTVAFLNCINMLGGSFFHSIIGFEMDFFWDGGMNEMGLREYSLDTYNKALLIIPACSFLGSIMVAIIGIFGKTKNVK